MALRKAFEHLALVSTVQALRLSVAPLTRTIGLITPNKAEYAGEFGVVESSSGGSERRPWPIRLTFEKQEQVHEQGGLR